MKTTMKTTVHSAGLAIFGCVIGALAQPPAAPPNLPAAPIPAKRVPAAQTSGKTQAKEPLQQYDFGGQLRVLQDPTGMDAQKAVPAAPVPAASGDSKPPKGFQPPADVPLNSTALDAGRVSESWRVTHNTPAAGADGRVLYAYGAGLPIIVCAPLRVCIIELQAGEHITGEPHIGDTVRWNVSPAMYGRGEESTSVIVIKPQEPGLDTNLLITTDRRAYYVRLVSKPQDYISQTGEMITRRNHGREVGGVENGYYVSKELVERGDDITVSTERINEAAAWLSERDWDKEKEL